jgi:hypothetical protein
VPSQRQTDSSQQLASRWWAHLAPPVMTATWLVSRTLGALITISAAERLLYSTSPPPEVRLGCRDLASVSREAGFDDGPGGGRRQPAAAEPDD